MGDAGPEIVKSGSLLADYDGPGPLIYLAFAVFVAVAPWRYAPLAGVVLSVMFLFGGFADPVFRDRLGTPSDAVDFGAGWLQMVAFAAAVAFGLAAVWLAPARSGERAATSEPTGPVSNQASGRDLSYATRSLRRPAYRNLRLPLGGLGLAVLGLIVQWISKPSIFEAPNWGALPGNFPPGVLVILVFSGLTVLFARWWWSPAFAAFIGVWIFFGGISTGEMANAFTKGNAGSIAGLVIMSVGLVVAIATGVLVMFQRRVPVRGDIAQDRSA